MNDDNVVNAAAAALDRATKGDDPTSWAGTPWWYVHQLLGVLRNQGYAPQELSAPCALCGAEAWEPCQSMSSPGELAPITHMIRKDRAEGRENQ